MGDGGDELAFHLLILADFQRHVVDILHQLSQLVFILVLHLNAVAPRGDALGGLGHYRHRLHHVVDKEKVGDKHHRQAQRRHQADKQHRQHHLPVYQPQRGNQPHHRLHLAVEGQGVGHRQNLLPSLRVPALEVVHPVLGDGPDDVVRPREGARRQSRGGSLDAAAGVDKLELDALLVLKGVCGLLGLFDIAGVASGHEVLLKGPGQRLGLLLQAVPHAHVVIAGDAHGEQHHCQHQQQQHRHHRVQQPPLPQAPHPEALPPFFLHRQSAPLSRVSQSYGGLTAPTCSRSPRPL